jgi:hypothetical protein
VTGESELLRRLQSALAQADVEAGDLVEQAWEEAREEVRAALRRLMVHDLLERALRSVQAPGSAASAGSSSRPAEGATATEGRRDPERAPDAETPLIGEGTATYLFGITTGDAGVPPGELPRLPGGGPLRVVEAAGLQALVCDIDPSALSGLQDPSSDDLTLLAETASAHDTILAAAARSATVLPLRLGTAVPDDTGARNLLAEHADALQAELARVRGHAEWAVTVRLLADPAAAEEPTPDGPTEADSGTDYLTRRRTQLRAREGRRDARTHLARAAHDRLTAAAAAADVVTTRPLEGAQPPLLHGVYLVADDGLSQFTEEVEALRTGQPDALIELSGPWPPYHFTTVRVGDPGEQP